MKTCCRIAILLVSTLVLSSGCVLMESAQEMSRQTLRVFKFRPSDYRDLAEEEDNEWDFVGQEGRGNLTRERDPDQWWKKWFMSEKARSIERNVGID